MAVRLSKRIATLLLCSDISISHVERAVKNIFDVGSGNIIKDNSAHLRHVKPEEPPAIAHHRLPFINKMQSLSFPPWLLERHDIYNFWYIQVNTSSLERFVVVTPKSPNEAALPVLRKAASNKIKMYLSPQTLYIDNLNPRKPRNHVKMALFRVFGMQGVIVEIHIPQEYTQDGFAFVAFSRPSEARRARIVLRGLMLFGRRINIKFAHRKSQALLINNRAPQTFWPVGRPFFRDEVPPAFCVCIRGYPRETMPLICDRILTLIQLLEGTRMAHVGLGKTYVEFHKYTQVLIGCKSLDGLVINKRNTLYTCIAHVSNIKAAYQGDTYF